MLKVSKSKAWKIGNMIGLWWTHESFFRINLAPSFQLKWKREAPKQTFWTHKIPTEMDTFLWVHLKSHLMNETTTSLSLSSVLFGFFVVSLTTHFQFIDQMPSIVYRLLAEYSCPEDYNRVSEPDREMRKDFSYILGLVGFLLKYNM